MKSPNRRANSRLGMFAKRELLHLRLFLAIGLLTSKAVAADGRGIVTRLFVGKRFGWQGTDVFHFDADGKIRKKVTYGWYGSRAHLQPELG